MVVAVGSPSGTSAAPMSLWEDVVMMFVTGSPTNFQSAELVPRSNGMPGKSWMVKATTGTCNVTDLLPSCYPDVMWGEHNTWLKTRCSSPSPLFPQGHRVFCFLREHRQRPEFKTRSGVAEPRPSGRGKIVTRR